MIDLAVCAILILVVVEDLRTFRIRNVYVCGLAIAFLADCVVRGDLGLILPHVLFAGVAFAALALAFSLKMIGGGDAKLLTVALLWIGLEGAFVFAVVLLTLTLITIVGAKLGLLPSRRTEKGLKFPFGPSIAGAWAAVLGLSQAL